MQADIWSMQATVMAVIVETIAIDIVFLCLVKKTKRRRIWWSELWGYVTHTENSTICQQIMETNIMQSAKDKKLKIGWLLQ